LNGSRLVAERIDHSSNRPGRWVDDIDVAVGVNVPLIGIEVIVGDNRLRQVAEWRVGIGLTEHIAGCKGRGALDPVYRDANAIVPLRARISLCLESGGSGCQSHCGARQCENKFPHDNLLCWAENDLASAELPGSSDKKHDLMFAFCLAGFAVAPQRLTR